MGISPFIVTQPRLCELLGLTRDQIRTLVAKDMPVHQRPQSRGGDWLFDVVAILRWALDGGAKRGGGHKIDIEAEQARLTKERADQAAMKNAAMRGELLPADKVSLAVTSAFARVRTRLLAIPPKAAPRLVGKAQPAEIQAALTDHVEEALRELSETEVLGESAADLDGGDGGDG